tara:strand:+ start:198 stop:464 length:267 start_codon:yes stop_codon:yes gene_type:complete
MRIMSNKKISNDKMMPIISDRSDKVQYSSTKDSDGRASRGTDKNVRAYYTGVKISEDLTKLHSFKAKVTRRKAKLNLWERLLNWINYA